MAQLDVPMEAPTPRSRSRSRSREEYQIVQQGRPRGLVGQVAGLVVQPGNFFHTLATTHSNQWFIAAAIILALVAYTAIRQAQLTATSTDTTAQAAAQSQLQQFSAQGAAGATGATGGTFSGAGGSFGGNFSGLPADAQARLAAINQQGSADTGITSTWMTAVIAAGSLAVTWLIQSVLLSEVSLFNGRAPRLGLNFRIAIWASLPLALMAVLQLAYVSAGGEPGEPGLRGMVSEWAVFQSASPIVQALLLSLASRLTLFWLWSLVLLYVGARYALRGRWWASLLVVVGWIAMSIVLPVAVGAIQAPETAQTLPNGATPRQFRFGDRQGQLPEGFDPSQLPEGFVPGQFNGEFQGQLPEGSFQGRQGGAGAQGATGDAAPTAAADSLGNSAIQGDVPEGGPPESFPNPGGGDFVAPAGGNFSGPPGSNLSGPAGSIPLPPGSP